MLRMRRKWTSTETTRYLALNRIDDLVIVVG